MGKKTTFLTLSNEVRLMVGDELGLGSSLDLKWEGKEGSKCRWAIWSRIDPNDNSS